MKKYALVFALSFFSTLASAQALQGNLENPVANSTESGIGLVSGWHCSARKITVTIDGLDLGESGVGSIRNDTAAICGDTGNGFSLLFNYNRLEPGQHTIRVFADDQLFAERQFSTVRSGGVPFLQGVTAIYELPDFPSPGSRAILQWSQAKQSFVVTSIQTGNQNNSTPRLSDLYGLVTLNYKFTNTSTVFSESTNFSSANVSNGTLVNSIIGNPSRVMACSIVPEELQRPYLCIIGAATGGIDVFLFSMTSGGAISGIYEFCLAGTSTSACAQDLVLTPDGTVTGSVNRASVGAAAIVTQSMDVVPSNSSAIEATKQIAKREQMPLDDAVPMTGQSYQGSPDHVIQFIDGFLADHLADRPALK